MLDTTSTSNLANRVEQTRANVMRLIDKIKDGTDGRCSNGIVAWVLSIFVKHDRTQLRG